MTIIGKHIRMERIMDRNSGRTLIVPLDHGVSVGPIEGIIDIKETVAQIAEGGAKKSFLGAAAGALVGLAIGVLDGGDIGNDIGRGAAVGAAGGAILGGVEAGSSGDHGRQIARDLANKQLDNRTIEPGTLGHGFLFFPGEAPDIYQLRLRLRDADSGEEYTVNLFP